MSGGTSAFLYDEHLEGWQLTKVVYYQTSLKIHNDWIRTTDLWYRNWLLRQLSEGTALPTEPQPLPEKVTVWMSLNVDRTNVGPTNVVALSFTSFHRFDWFFAYFRFCQCLLACLVVTRSCGLESSSCFNTKIDRKWKSENFPKTKFIHLSST